MAWKELPRRINLGCSLLEPGAMRISTSSPSVAPWSSVTVSVMVCEPTVSDTCAVAEGPTARVVVPSFHS